MRGHTRPDQTVAPLPGIVQQWDGSSLHWGVIILDLLQRWNGGKDMSGLQWGGERAPWKWLCLGMLCFTAVWVLEGRSICQTSSDPDVFLCFQALLSLSSVLHLSVLSFPFVHEFPTTFEHPLLPAEDGASFWSHFWIALPAAHRCIPILQA